LERVVFNAFIVKAKQRQIQMQKKTLRRIIWHAHTILRFGKKLVRAMTFHSNVLSEVKYLKHIHLSMS
jgi:hypothetical protein